MIWIIEELEMVKHATLCIDKLCYIVLQYMRPFSATMHMLLKTSYGVKNFDSELTVEL